MLSMIHADFFIHVLLSEQGRKSDLWLITYSKNADKLFDGVGLLATAKKKRVESNFDLQLIDQ